jgi:K+-transporting ATPase KdpF subunit
LHTCTHATGSNREIGAAMFGNIVILVICALVLIYLLFALLRPEKF